MSFRRLCQCLLQSEVLARRLHTPPLPFRSMDRVAAIVQRTAPGARAWERRFDDEGDQMATVTGTPAFRSPELLHGWESARRGVRFRWHSGTLRGLGSRLGTG